MSPGFVEFLLAAIVMELTPGPNMTWLALLAAQQGRIAGLQAVAGIAAGLSVLAVFSATSAAALVSAYPAIYEVMRWGGVLFVLYLAFEAWQGEKAARATDDRGRHFRRGLFINILNPKAAAVFLVMIPGFATQVDERQPPVILMTVIYLAIATTAHALVVVFASAFRAALSDPRRELIVRRVFALLLVAIAIWLALSTVRPAA